MDVPVVEVAMELGPETSKIKTKIKPLDGISWQAIGKIL